MALALTTAPADAVHVAGHSGGTPIVLDFEKLSGTELKDQYSSSGVTFDPAVIESDFPRLARSPTHLVTLGPPGCGRQYHTTVGAAHAPGRSRFASRGGASPFSTRRGRRGAQSEPNECRPLRMTFTRPPSRVQAWVGHRYSLCEKMSVRLEGFDVGGRSVGATVETLEPSQPPRPASLLLQLVPKGPVATATLGVENSAPWAGCEPTNWNLVVDDVEFEMPVAAADPSVVDFGEAGGTTPTITRGVRVTSTGLTDLVVRRPVLAGADAGDFAVVKEDCSTRRALPPGVTCTVDVQFRPAGTGDRRAALQVFSNDPRGPTRTELKGRAAVPPTTPSGSAASVAPDRLDFGQSQVGTSGATRTVTVAAAAGGAAVEVDEVRIDPPTGDFSLAGAACSGTTLKAGTSCVVEVRFRPGAAGRRAATLEVAAGTPRVVHRVALTGAGTEAAVPSATLTPDPLELGAATVGRDASTSTLIVANPGTAPLVVRGVAVAGPERGDFTVAADRCSGARVAPGGTCTVEVRFLPGAAGLRAATLSVRTNAADSPHQVALRGSGVDVGGEVLERASLDVRPGSGPRGAKVAVTGSGFSGRTELSWHSQAPGTPLAVVVPGVDQRIDLSVTVPTDATPGGHEVVACDAEGECARAGFAVELASSPVATGGRNRLLLLLAGLVVLAVVVPAAVALRRRLQGAPALVPPPPPKGPDEPTRPRSGGGRGERQVHTGFSPAGDYATGLDPSEPLQPGRPYHFWFELGAAAPTVTSSSAQLTVALFDYSGELEIDPAADTGELELRGDGSAVVARQGGLHTTDRPGDELLGRRVFFRVRTPAVEGRHRLRCSLYCRQVLVQSWVVSADVRRRPTGDGDGADPQARERDFVLSRSLDPAALAGIRPHRLSVMLNDNDEGTHGLRLLGEGGFKSSATFDVAELAEHGAQVRRALRRVACGEEEEAVLPAPYRYDDTVDLERLRQDLASLARRGYRVYSAVVHELARGAPDEVGTADRLAELLRRPGRVQLCNRQGARHSLPAALVYDRALDDAIPDLELCPAFVDAMSSATPLGDTPCFLGDCPTLGLPDVVCPSGFWGFRHVIGAPQSLGDADAAPLEAPLEVATGGQLVIDVGVSTDPGFVGRAVHEEVLRSLHPSVEWNYGDSRAEVLKVLRSTQPHLVYFYCHGGLDEASGVPFIEVGPPGETPITGSNLLAYRVLWDRSHPLVMVNGCHTTALGPQTPLELVSAFVQHSQAAGVIGTEITVFEPLACAFAEQLLRRFLGEGLPVGDAVQQARLALLHQGNPLGLAYVAFVAGDLRITERPAGVPVGAR